MAGGRFHFRFQVSGFRVEVAGCRSEVRFQVSRLRVQGLFQGFKESGFRLQGCRVVGFRFQVAELQGCRFQVSGFSFRFKVSGFLVQGSEFQISEFQVCFLLSSPPYVPLPPPPPPPPPTYSRARRAQILQTPGEMVRHLLHAMVPRASRSSVNHFYTRKKSIGSEGLELFSRRA